MNREKRTGIIHFAIRILSIAVVLLITVRAITGVVIARRRQILRRSRERDFDFRTGTYRQMIIPLARAYPARDGSPVLTHVDTAIFFLRYFQPCMECGFCHDACCYQGADVDLPNVHRILTRADEIEKVVEYKRGEWFEPAVSRDLDFPAGQFTLTRVEKGKCVFLTTNPRGCSLHGFSLNENRDYHELKPMVCSLFPLTFENGLLRASDEVNDTTLICVGTGVTVYEGGRAELRYYFGDDLIAQLDELVASLQ